MHVCHRHAAGRGRTDPVTLERCTGVRCSPDDPQGIGEEHGQCPRAAVGDLHHDRGAGTFRVGADAGEQDALGAALDHESGHGRHRLGVEAPRPADELGIPAHDVDDPPLVTALVAREEPPQRAAQSGEGRGGRRGAAPVDTHARRDPGEFGERGHDVPLQRMVRIEVAGRLPPGRDARREHGRMLAGTVLREPRRLAGSTGGLRVQGPVGRVLQGGVGQVDRGERRECDLLMHLEPGVRGAGEGELLVGELHPGAQHRERLERLRGRTGIELDLAAGTKGHRPLGGVLAVRPAGERRHESVAVVHGLDEVAAAHMCENGGITVSDRGTERRRLGPRRSRGRLARQVAAHQPRQLGGPSSKPRGGPPRRRGPLRPPARCTAGRTSAR